MGVPLTMELEDGKNHWRVIKSQPFHNRTLQDFFTGIFKEAP
jgi:hypothetical protein